MEKENNMGMIAITKPLSNKEYSFFGHKYPTKDFIEMSFKKAKVSNIKNSDMFISDKRILYNIMMSSEQYTSLLMHKNNQNGIPCTISQDEEGNNYEYINSKKENNELSKLMSEFNTRLIELYPNAYKIKPKIKELLYQEKINPTDRKKLQLLLNELINEDKNNKEEFKKLYEKFILNLNEISKKSIEKEIKKNMFGFASFNQQKEAQNLIGILNGDKKLIENKDNQDNQDNQDNPIKKENGIITLKEIKNNEGFFADENSKNGFQIDLYQAKEKIINGEKIILKGELLMSNQMSASQFSKLLTSFNSKGVESSILYTKKIGGIVQENHSLNNIELKIKNFYNNLIESETLIDKNISYLETTLKKNNRKESNKTSRNII